MASWPRPLVIVAVAAVLSLGASLLGLVAASFAPGVSDIVRAAQSGAAARAGLSAASDDLEWAAAIAVDGARWLAEAAAINAALAETGADDARAAALTHAITLVEDSLSASPVQPVQWARLALFRFARDGATLDGDGRTLSALTLSFLLGPHEMDAWMPRLRVALTAWEQMPEDIRRATTFQVRAALRWYKHEPLAQFWRTASPAIKQNLIGLINQRPGEAVLFWAELAKER